MSLSLPVIWLNIRLLNEDISDEAIMGKCQDGECSHFIERLPKWLSSCKLSAEEVQPYQHAGSIIIFRKNLGL